MGEVQTNEKTTVYAHDLDLFVTAQILEDACSPIVRQALRRTWLFL